jgi:hypothetical protein
MFMMWTQTLTTAMNRDIGITQKYFLSQHEMKNFCFIMMPHQEKSPNPWAEGFSGKQELMVYIFIPV